MQQEFLFGRQHDLEGKPVRHRSIIGAGNRIVMNAAGKEDNELNEFIKITYSNRVKLQVLFHSASTRKGMLASVNWFSIRLWK
jgi:hypothetical protein